MKSHIIFILVMVAVAWASALLGWIDIMWVRVAGGFLGFFGFLFVFMLTDEVSDFTRSFGIDLIVIAVAYFIIWV